MAETAYIVNPGKTVLLPEIRSVYPMADMITAEKLIEKKKEIPGAVVVCYVNSTAGPCKNSNRISVVPQPTPLKW